jgi:HlyD family secretion protein
MDGRHVSTVALDAQADRPHTVATTANGEMHKSPPAESDSVEPPTGSGLIKKLLLAGVALVLLVLVSAKWILPAMTGTGVVEHDQSEPREKPSSALHMRVMKPMRGKDRTTTQPATVQSFDIVEIYAQATGKLKDQTVDIDSRVKKGELMARIDAPDVFADYKRAVAGLEKAKAAKLQADKQVEVAKSGLEVAKSMVERRKAQLHQAKAYLVFRDAELKRYEKLLAKQVIESQVVDEERDRREAALASVEAAKEGVNTAEYDVPAKEAQWRKAQADVEEAIADIGVAKAQLDRAKVLTDFTEVRADFDGVVTQRNYNEGAYIRSVDRSGGQQPLLVLKSVDKFRVVVMIPDVDVPFVSIGDPAELVIATIRPEPFIGKVARTARSEDYKSRTMRVEVDIYNTTTGQKNGPKQDILRDNMYGYITIHLLKAPKPAFMLPSKTVHEDLETKERFVYVVRQKRAHKVVVHAGPDDGKLIGILGGLKADDLVVIQDNGLLHEDSEVEAELVAASRVARE